MKKLIYYIGLTLSIGILGCASYLASYSVKTMNDEFDGYTINRMQKNRLGGGILLGSIVDLNVQKFVKDSLVVYSLIVRYEGHDWLFIQNGESLILLVDNERIGLVGDGSVSHRDVLSGGLVKEQAWYDNITPEQLKKIAYATEVKIKIIGSQYHAERYFTSQNFQNFQQFYSEYVENNNE
jgi:hypothetical protein